MGAGMQRRDFILGLGTAAICSNAARGQQKQFVAQHSSTTKRMAHVDPALNLEGMQAASRPFYDELKRLGYVEGENLVVERYSGGGRMEGYQSLAKEVVDTKPDLILSIGANLTNRFKTFTKTIPIIAVTGDPIRFGIVSNIARPGGNITGVSVDAGVEIWGKRLEILSEAVPGLIRVAYLSTQGNLESAGGKATQEVARKIGVSLVPAAVKSPVNEAEYRRVFDSIHRDQVDGLMFSAEFEHQPHRFLIIQLLQQARLPAIHIFPDDVEAGALMSYALDPKPPLLTMAKQAAQILNGANPGDMPYVQVVHFELAVNLKTAKVLGLELPAALLARADRVIE
jgi:ABC-type uncharacterized transport system substrate-binding protein